MSHFIEADTLASPRASKEPCPRHSSRKYFQFYCPERPHSSLDFAFGRLMQTLDELKLMDDTFVVFTADNGPEGSGQPNLKNPGSQQDRTRGSTGGLGGRKRSDFEGGVRVPGIVRWPGKVRPGTESDTPVVGTDLFATLLEIAQVPLPTDRTIDAASILPVFRNEPIERSRPLYWRTHISPPECRVAVRVGDWKIGSMSS